MARVLIVHHKWDADVAEPLAGHFRRLGHSVLLHIAGEPLPSSPLDESTPLALIWSGALTMDDQALPQAALLSVRHNTVLVRIDDTEPPPDMIDSTSIVSAASYQTQETLAAVTRALRLSDPTAPVFFSLPSWRIPPPLSGFFRQQAQWSRLGIVALAVTALGFSLAFWTGNRERPIESASLTTNDGLRPRHTPSHEARLLAEALHMSEDPLALQAALTALGTTPEAEPLRARLALLEDRAWRDVAGREDAAARLLAIEAFRAAFPSSGRLDGEVGRAVRQARDQILAAQSSLSSIGFDAGPANGVMTAQTEAAVRAFQEAMALPNTGAIDERLLSALGAAVDSRPQPQTQNSSSLRGGAPMIGEPRALDLAEGTPSRLAGVDPAPGRLAVTNRRASAPAPFSIIQDCAVCPALIVLPRGRGQVGDGGSAGAPQERPARTVTLDYGLAMGRFEVTTREWNACVADNGCPRRPQGETDPSSQRPATGVSYEDARLYMAWLQRRTGHGYRLPSEAEWEFAARAGTLMRGTSDPSRNLCALGNIADSASFFPDRDIDCRDGFPAEHAPVGQFRPNAFGLYDMIGNAWEWTEDCWHATYTGAPRTPAPWLRACDTRQRVLRGGSYMTGPSHNRLSARLPIQADLRLVDVGFRVVRPVAD
jgi:formylglycine-generating enzyme required for sulfatase activity